MRTKQALNKLKEEPWLLGKTRDLHLACIENWFQIDEIYVTKRYTTAAGQSSRIVCFCYYENIGGQGSRCAFVIYEISTFYAAISKFLEFRGNMLVVWMYMYICK